ncbi:MAG: histidinol dehydrogenase, partial [Casimicrobiaceae bacterium]
MATWIKRAQRTPEAAAGDTRETVERMLRDIEDRGEQAVREYAERLDGWTGDFIVGADAIARAGAGLPQRLRDDLAFAHRQVDAFARRQRESLLEFEAELHPGLITGQRLIPVNVAGCYVPSG